MKQSVWHWLAVTAIFIGSVMLALSVVLDPNRMLGAFRDSMWMAVAINLGFGLFSGYLGGLIKFLDSRDSMELALLVGVKIALFVFALLMVVSIGLKLFAQPPTAAPGTLILAPLAEPGLLMCCCDPMSWLLVGFTQSGGSSRKERLDLEDYTKAIRDEDDEDRRRRK